MRLKYEPAWNRCIIASWQKVRSEKGVWFRRVCGSGQVVQQKGVWFRAGDSGQVEERCRTECVRRQRDDALGLRVEG